MTTVVAVVCVSYCVTSRLACWWRSKGLVMLVHVRLTQDSCGYNVAYHNQCVNISVNDRIFQVHWGPPDSLKHCTSTDHLPFNSKSEDRGDRGC